MKTKKYYTPSCIKDYMNKVNVYRINVSVFAMPKKPYSKSHH